MFNDSRYVLLLVGTVLIISMCLFRREGVVEHLENKKDGTDGTDGKNGKNGADGDADPHKQDYCKALGMLGAGGSVLGAGKQGPRGPPGPSGGSYIARGRFGVIGAGEGVGLTRMFGKGAYAKAYMDKAGHESHRHWELRGDGKLANDYGNCLAAGKDGSLYMVACDGKGEEAKKWDYNKKTQMMSMKVGKGALQCLTLSSPSKIMHAQVIGATGGDGKPTIAKEKDFAVASLTDCSSGDNNQKWFFF